MRAAEREEPSCRATADEGVYLVLSPTVQSGCNAIAMPLHAPGVFGRPKTIRDGDLNILRPKDPGAWTWPEGRRIATTRRGDYEGSWDDRERPSFFSRLRRVLGGVRGWRPAPRGPSMTHFVCCRTARMWFRCTSARVAHGLPAGCAPAGQDVGMGRLRAWGRSRG